VQVRSADSHETMQLHSVPLARTDCTAPRAHDDDDAFFFPDSVTGRLLALLLP
jgi:hypothetical protein